MEKKENEHRVLNDLTYSMLIRVAHIEDIIDTSIMEAEKLLSDIAGCPQ